MSVWLMIYLGVEVNMRNECRGQIKWCNQYAIDTADLTNDLVLPRDEYEMNEYMRKDYRGKIKWFFFTSER